MTGLILVEIIAILALLVCSAFFSSAEVAFFSLNEIQLHQVEEKHGAAGKRVRSILERPTRLLSTILIGNTLVNVCASVICFALLKNASEAYAEPLSITIMTLLLLVFGEVGPKRVAMLMPERMTLLYAPVLQGLIPIVMPVRFLMERITQRFRHRFHRRGRTLTEEEFEGVLDLSSEEGVLDEDERAMVKAIIRLEDLKASDVMTPRVDIIGLDLDDLPEDPVDYVCNARVRRLLLYHDQLDHVEGFLDVKTFLLEPDHDIQKAWISPLYVPETAPLDQLLRQLQREKRRAAVVVDEYGGTAGIITRGDILEEIVGEINDVYAEHKLEIEKLGNNRWLIDGELSLEDLNEKLDLDLGDEGEDRISGWVMRIAEHLPRPGETVEADGCRVTVQRVRKHRIELVLLEKLQAGEDDT
jgi:CBS domain containing-hemolysin-like protein